MRAMISLCAVLLLAAVGCSKTDESAGRETAPMDQPAPTTPPSTTDDTGAGAPGEPGTMPPPTQEESTPPATPPPDQ